jgi:hypothetical protein
MTSPAWLLDGLWSLISSNPENRTRPKSSVNAIGCANALVEIKSGLLLPPFNTISLNRADASLEKTPENEIENTPTPIKRLWKPGQPTECLTLEYIKLGKV